MCKKLLVLIVAISLLFPTTPVRAEGTGPVQRLGTGIPTSIAASPDGKTLAVGSSMGVWFLDATMFTPTGFWDTSVWVDSVAYSMDGQYLRVNEMVYEVASGSVVEVGEVAWVDHRCSFDGRFCVEQDVRDGFVYSTKVVDRDTLVVTKILEVGIDDIAWSSNGEFLYTVGYEYEWRNRRNSDYLIKAWDTKAWNEVQRAKNLFADRMLNILWSPDGVEIASDRFVWDVNTGQLVRGWDCQWWSGRGGFNCDWLPMNYGWSSLLLYDLTTHRLLHEFTPHHIVLWSATLNADRQRLATSGQDNLRDCPKGTGLWYLWQICKTRDVSTRIWDVDTLELLGELPTEFYSVKFSNDGKLIIGHTRSGVEVWDWAGGQNLWSAEEAIACQPYPPGGVRCGNSSNGLAINSEFVASYAYPSTANMLYLHRLTTGELVATLTGHTAPITGVAFSPDGTKVAAGSQDGTILIWDVP